MPSSPPKKAIPFSLALRLRRICSTDAKFKHRINELKTYLLARGYNYNFLEEQFLRAANISRTNALQTKPKASNDVVPFVVTYNPALPRISNILRKHFNILHSSNRCKDVFKQPPFVAYRRSPNLRDILVKAQLPVISNNHFPPSFAKSRPTAQRPAALRPATAQRPAAHGPGRPSSPKAQPPAAHGPAARRPGSPRPGGPVAQS